MQNLGRVLRVPHVPWLLATALLARLPYGIEGLSTILFVQEQRDSFAAAGVVSAAGGVAAGVGLPILGRLIDVLGQTRVILAALVVHACAGAALVVLGLGDAPTAALAAAAALGGLTVPPISPALRGLWPMVLKDDPQALRAALALDAITLEFVFIGGPAITAALVAVASPAFALAFGFAVAAAGATAFALSHPSRRWRGSGSVALGLGPLASRGLLVLLAVSVPVGYAFGTMEVALPAFGVSEGSPTLGALAVAALAGGSAIGGLWYAARPPRRVALAYVALCAVLPAGTALLALGDSVALMLLLAPLAGATIAPITAAGNELAGDLSPEGTVTEAYAWVITATIVGYSAGAAVGGSIIEASGWRDAVLVGAGVAVGAAALALGGRRTLTA